MCEEKVCRSLRVGAGATFWRRLLVQAGLALVALAVSFTATLPKRGTTYCPEDPFPWFCWPGSCAILCP